MQEHGCLAELGAAVQHERLAAAAATQKVLCKPDTPGELGCAEDRLVREHIRGKKRIGHIQLEARYS
jgi:hypothetical protein